MFEWYTDSARRVVTVAQDQARNLEHDYIDLEHLLLALAVVDSGAAKALRAHGLTEQAIKSCLTRGDHLTAGHIPFTPNAKALLELGRRHALKHSHNYIAPEHLLVPMLSSERPVYGNSQILQHIFGQLGVDPGVVVAAAQQALDQHSAPPAEVEPALAGDITAADVRRILGEVFSARGTLPWLTVRLAEGSSRLEHLAGQVAEQRLKALSPSSQPLSETTCIREVDSLEWLFDHLVTGAVFRHLGPDFIAATERFIEQCWQRRIASLLGQ